MASSSSHTNAVSFGGKTYCVITGASRGIGRAIAAEISPLLGPGSVVLLLARDGKGLAETAELCRSDNVRAMYYPIDLGTATGIDMQQALFDSIELEKLDDFNAFVIFHNVGSLGNLQIEARQIENNDGMHEYFNLNLFNVISLNTQFLKLIQEYKERAVIVNISSLCAIKPMGGMAYYCSAKAARDMYFRVLSEENKDVSVLNYAPGPVETAMADEVICNTVNSNLREVFESFKAQNVFLKPEVTAKKCLRILQEGKFKSGDHVDYFDYE